MGMALVGAKASAAELELELGAGAGATGIDPNGALTGRIGIDLAEHFTPSLRGVALGQPASGLDLWALLAELRAHTSGRLQLTGGVAFGVGSLLVGPGPGDSVSANLHRTMPYILGDIGLRLMLSNFWLGASVGGSPTRPGYLGTLYLGWAPFDDRD